MLFIAAYNAADSSILFFMYFGDTVECAYVELVWDSHLNIFQCQSTRIPKDSNFFMIGRI